MIRIVGYGVTWMGRRVTDEQGYDMIFFGLVLMLGGTLVLMVMCREYGVRGLFQVRPARGPARDRGTGRSRADRRTGRQARERRPERPAPVRQADARPVPAGKGGRPAPARKGGRPVPASKGGGSKGGRPVPVSKGGSKGGRPVPARKGGRPAQGRPEVYLSGRPETPPHRDDVPDETYQPPARPGTVYRSTRPDGSTPPEGRHASDDRHSRGTPHQIPHSVPPRRRSAPADHRPPEP
jgi:hypothetical protein